MMRCILRMSKPENRTTRADVLVELVNPSRYELYSMLAHLIQEGTVSALISNEGGSTLFHEHSVCVDFVTRYNKEVCS